jgi:peptidoglycan hydrolase-like protein with peptidoglycan-binding domain
VTLSKSLLGRRHLAVAAISVMALAACGDDTEPTSVEAAQARVADAEDALDEARAALDDSTTTFCDDSEDYITAVDRYGSAFNQAAATVGDVTTAGADLAEPREAVQSSADEVVTARDDLAQAERELADAQVALAEAQTSTSAGPSSTTTTTPLVPAASLDRVERAEDDLATVTEGINDQTPLSDATTQLNAAAFAVEVSALRVFADAGCLTTDQEQQAVTALVEYTTALQTSLQTAGYYDDEIDGVYGSATVDAVEALQTDNGLPVTGLVDEATDAALDAAVGATGDQASQQALTDTAAVQSTLKLAGYWTGPLDGQWTPELTDALESFQTDLGVTPTGAVDAATLAALEQAITDARTPTTTTPTGPTTTGPTSTTTEPT